MPLLDSKSNDIAIYPSSTTDLYDGILVGWPWDELDLQAGKKLKVLIQAECLNLSHYVDATKILWSTIILLCGTSIPY